MGHSRAMLDHFGPFGVIFGPLWGILGHFMEYLDKFAESSNFFAATLGSWGSLLECMKVTSEKSLSLLRLPHAETEIPNSTSNKIFQNFVTITQIKRTHITSYDMRNICKSVT